ncbi:MAG: MATE family efflux transporter [Bacteroidota bacterium]
MNKKGKSDNLGTLPVGTLLRQQAIPASIGILIMSVYGIIDTIFVGQWIGALAIGAITVVLPITFLIASVGMAIGIGGASVISRALGSEDNEKAFRAFGNQISLTLLIATSVVIGGLFFQEEILQLFGGKGEILPYAKTYFSIVLLGVPFLAWAMMSNNVIRALGQPKMAMYTLIVPAIANLILDPVLIIGFDMGMAGAAWATTLGYVASAFYTLWFFLKRDHDMEFAWENLKLQPTMVREIFSIGGVTLARQGTISILAIVLNNTLFSYGGERSVSVYGIINRVMFFANFPVLGIVQGFLPIAGFNFGAKKYQRVKEVIFKSIGWGTSISFIIFACILFFAEDLSIVFTSDVALVEQTSPALVAVFLATPTLVIQLIGSAYYQAIGKALPALFLSLLKQGIFLIPLILILPRYFGLNGVWYSFPIADVGTAFINFLFLRHAYGKLNTDTGESEATFAESKILDADVDFKKSG